MKTLVILTGSFPPTNIVGALRPYRLAKHIERAGWKVLVLTHPPKPGHDLDDSLLEELGPSCEIHYVSQQVSGNDDRSKFNKRVAGTARNILNKWIKPDSDILYVPAYFRTFCAVKKQHHSSTVVLTTSPAHSIHLAGLWIKNKFNLPWVVDFRDPWDDYLKSGKDEIRNPFEKYFERKVIKNSSAVISTTHTYTDALSSRHTDVEREKFHTITNSYDRQKTLKIIEKSKDKFIICYTGIFYPDKDPYGFFRALRKWFDNMEAHEINRYRGKLEIQLIGSGDRVTRQRIEDLHLEENVVFFDRMPHENAIEMTRKADLALISTGLGGKTRSGWLPSKLFEYLGCRVPILALIREGEMAQIICESNSGYVLTTDIDAMVGELIKGLIDRKFYLNDSDIVSNFDFFGVERFEEKNVMGKFIKIIESLVS